MKRRTRPKREKQKMEVSMIGRIVDMSMPDFKSELVTQNVNIGTMNNLILNLESVYNELRVRKEHIMNAILKNTLQKDDPQVKCTLDGLYAEMIKTEQKIVYLKERVKELVDVG